MITKPEWTRAGLARVRHAINRTRSLAGRRVCYVTDGAGWSFDWDAHYVTENLRKRGVGARVTCDVLGVRNQIIQYGDRYTYLDGTFRKLHPSNHVFLTWFHGGADSQASTFEPMLATLRDEAMESVDRVVVSCGTTRKGLLSAGIPESKITVIPIGIDLQTFRPRSAASRAEARERLGIPADAVCIGSFQKDGEGWGVGDRPKLIKGPDLFLDAAEILYHSESRLMVLLTGPSRGYVKKGLEARGIPYAHVNVADYLEMPVYYDTLDLYLITSREEGGPKALMESWATGVPLVSTNMGMPADLVEDGESGLLVPVGDAEALAAAAQRVLEDSALRERCVAGGADQVIRLDWPKIAAMYHDLYGDLI